jgi:hypothetical protein
MPVVVVVVVVVVVFVGSRLSTSGSALSFELQVICHVEVLFVTCLIWFDLVVGRCSVF